MGECLVLFTIYLLKLQYAYMADGKELPAVKTYLPQAAHFDKMEEDMIKSYFLGDMKNGKKNDAFSEYKPCFCIAFLRIYIYRPDA